MKLYPNGWFCPLCGEQGALIGGAKPSDVYISNHGGGAAVCTKCAKERKADIQKENEIFHGNPVKKKDSNCKHEWLHPYEGRWYCPKCGAYYNWMCGCGGSEYVCQTHYNTFIADAIKECGTLEKFLAKHSW